MVSKHSKIIHHYYTLSGEGIDIKSVSIISPGIEDVHVLEMAYREKRVLITFDTDFGELVFKRKLKSSGVILLRIHPYSVESILYLLYKAFSRSVLIDFSITFCVVEDGRIRVRYLSS